MVNDFIFADFFYNTNFCISWHSLLAKRFSLTQNRNFSTPFLGKGIEGRFFDAWTGFVKETWPCLALVLPALFIWLDTGIQILRSETTFPSQGKFLDSQLCELPLRDFSKKYIKHNAILMLSPNLQCNRIFFTQGDTSGMLKILESYIERFRLLLTGESRNGWWRTTSKVFP